METKKGWIANNNTFVIAISWTLIAATVILITLTKVIRSDDKTTYLILNNVFSISMLILGYYFVSSKNSSEKSALEAEIKKLREASTVTSIKTETLSSSIADSNKTEDDDSGTTK